MTGDNFHMLSNPYIGVAWFHCPSCNAKDFISGFEWADTGEDVVAFRRRVRKYTPKLLRFFREGYVFWLAIALGVLTWLIAREFVQGDRLLFLKCMGGWIGAALAAFLVSEPLAARIDYRDHT
ncbi:hypothetical protein [Gemmata sp.]|uniref:hypothetical protein n=1 Tax=Gemmata sp. TaxID=1914242 RepID=UPI003F6F6B10